MNNDVHKSSMNHEITKPGTLRNSQCNQAEEPELTRRSFLGRCAAILPGITIVSVLAPIVNACDTTLEPRIDTGSGNNGSTTTKTFDVSMLTADGQGILTQQKGSDGFSIMIVRITAQEYAALSTRCTHQGCDVNTPANGSITCPCHGSRFSLNGAVLTGPATQQLKTYTLTHNATANTVTVTLS